MDIKDIKRAMDNMPLGDGSAFAEISVGPAKHEQFLDDHYGKLALVGLLIALGVAGWIIYHGMQETREKEAAGELVAALPLSHETGSMSLENQGLEQVRNDFPGSNASATSQYLQAFSLWNSGRDDDGNACIREFIAQAPTPAWKAQASVALACRLMNSGKRQEAKELFQSVADEGKSPLAAFSLLCLGDMARAEKNMEAAGNYYRELSEKYPDSSFVNDPGAAGYALRKALFDVHAPTIIDVAETK